MASFLEKIKGEADKEKRQEKVDQIKANTPEQPEGVLQLDVDIYETSSGIMIHAPMAGVNPDTLEILMEDEADVITIRGEKNRPGLQASKEEEKWLVQECEWGSFFRQIILPQEVDASRITAKLTKGVLVLRLPLLKDKAEKKKITISDIS